ncbi:helicase associated domain-containing protein [Streptomyces sp. NBC_01571]|uniref:helicase associated domain-containing protein n=1 Tax=Streptomyces sp. NBC_01571 TaxID=2975883 RepID=UPI00225AC0A1|nr:helicase associated domain-containing protein [Streptomyces sp. NBC_01571]MCX4580820.1 helicase associated domain-containing protein [Streptomyces sp. NBC_01571]
MGLPPPAGGALPVRAGEVLVQGEDLGAWTMAQRVGWDALTPAQQWMLDSVLGLEPAGEAEQPPARRTQADRWAGHLAVARQFHAREGHLNVPRKHVEDVGGVPVKLGGFLDNTRRRGLETPLERRAELDALGMRW